MCVRPFFNAKCCNKKRVASEDIVYVIDKSSEDVWRLSKGYFSSIKLSNDEGWGWFYIKEGKLMSELPEIKSIIDSLEPDTSNKGFYIWESNGNIFFNIDGKPVKFLSYGNLVTKNSLFNFDSLDYKLYKLDGDSLRAVSENGNDLIKQQDGIYFIPSPGYPVGRKYSKAQIMNALDSASKLISPPKVLKFDTIK